MIKIIKSPRQANKTAHYFIRIAWKVLCDRQYTLTVIQDSERSPISYLIAIVQVIQMLAASRAYYGQSFNPLGFGYYGLMGAITWNKLSGSFAY